MSRFAYLLDTDNLIGRAQITTLSADAAYPKTNLAALPISKPWRSVAPLSSEWILMDFGSPVTVDLVAIVNHNLSSQATVAVSAGTTSACSNYTGSPAIAWRQRDAFTLLPAAQSYRFWKIIVTDAGNLDGYLSIGYLAIGDSTTSTFNYRDDWQWVPEQVNSEYESEFGGQHVTELFDRRRFTLPFWALNTTREAALVAMLAATKRNVHPLFLIPDAAVNDGYFGRWQRDPRFRVPWTTNRETELEFLEESRGLATTEAQPFSYDVGDSLTDLSATFARAGTANQTDETLDIDTIATGVARDAHYPNLGTRTLLLEGPQTNSFTRSEELDHADWVKTNATCSGGAINCVAAPDGAVTGDLLVEASDVGQEHYFAQALPALADSSQQAVSFFARGGAVRYRVFVRTKNKANAVKTSWVNLNTGAVGTKDAGHGIRVTAFQNWWFRIECLWNSSAGGTTPTVQIGLAAADGQTSYNGDGSSGVYFWGMQLEKDRGVVSSYIATAAAGVTRPVETVYFPFTAVPQQLTFYARFVEHGTIDMGGDLGVMAVCNAAAGTPVFELYRATRYTAFFHNGVGSVNSEAATAPVVGDLVELRATLKSDGKVQLHQSINGAAEASAVESAALAMAAAWAAEELYLNSVGTAYNGANAFISVRVFRGVQTLEYCRAH